MSKPSSLIIINEKNLRGVIASGKVISKKLLEDVIDFIELSGPESIKETCVRVKEANRKKSWMSLEEVRRLAKKMK